MKLAIGCSISICYFGLVAALILGNMLMKTIAPKLFIRRRAADNGPAPGSSSPGAGQAPEFRHVMLPHLDAAYNLTRYLTGDPVLAEDMAQDAGPERASG